MPVSFQQRNHPGQKKALGPYFSSSPLTGALRARNRSSAIGGQTKMRAAVGEDPRRDQSVAQPINCAERKYSKLSFHFTAEARLFPDLTLTSC